jgi:ADP-ribose pyrophosphatase
LKKYISLISVVLIFTAVSVVADTTQHADPNLESYFNYMRAYPNTLGPLGNAAKGEIEIVLDKRKIAEIEKTTGRMVGIMAEDKYWLWLNDAVKFPNNKYGVYGRLIWKCSLKDGRPGAIVVAVLPNGKIVLNRNFRHATRSWEYELPRGIRNPNENLEDTAKREIKEETGMKVQNVVLLGEMGVDSGTLNSIDTVFYAEVISQQAPNAEESEAIASIDAFSIEELKQGYINGYLTTEINKQKQQVPLRDPFLAYALFMIDLKK